ncbi:hypothetical protein FYC62_04085 [Pedobacter aquae]|uniref:Uncharacterized protein n=1 Tax=Pedobacter aquae TaxID=2605747 RepID=A0A5C0VC69_9SPHI|nr:DUF6266 family protein [Pedobacter aquae]QEK50358.1 hypothetical protein FYC62_00750 [Pedobacter aquae]QEK50943.1 hypothetical protein FYC62_04085 [Pedobacter aquae]
MAFIKSDSFYAGLSGKVGDLIFCKGTKGTIVRRASQNKSNHHPTPGQEECRSRFVMANKFLLTAAHVLKMGAIENEEIEVQKRNRSAIRKSIVGGVYPHLFIDFSKLILTKGKMSLPDKLNIKLKEHKLEISWNSRKVNTQSELIIACYSAIQNCWITQLIKFRKDEQSHHFTIPNSLHEGFECYAFVRAINRQAVSNSKYFGGFQCIV